MYPNPAVRPPNYGYQAPTLPPAGQPQVHAVPGTPFGLMYLGVRPLASGQAIGGMVAGIASILASGFFGLLGLAAASSGAAWSIAPAFAFLGLVISGSAVGLGAVGLRQVRASAGRTSGRGMALAAIICGSIGAAFTVLGLLLAVAANQA